MAYYNILKRVEKNPKKGGNMIIFIIPNTTFTIRVNTITAKIMKKAAKVAYKKGKKQTGKLFDNKINGKFEYWWEKRGKKLLAPIYQRTDVLKAAYYCGLAKEEWFFWDYQRKKEAV